MSKYEQVIKGLECCTNENEQCLICPYTDSPNSCIDDLEKDALEVLKAQPQVVQCRDCKNSECVGRFGDIVCGRTGTPHRPEWYCPCGEPKDGEQDDTP